MMKSERGKLRSGAVAGKGQPFSISCRISLAKYQQDIYVTFGGLLGYLGPLYLHCNEFDLIEGHLAILVF